MKYFILLALFAVASCDLSCDQAPHILCSNEKLAKMCNVADRCPNLAKLSVQSVSDAPPVALAVYYETLCPDSQHFFRTQLWPTFLAIGHIMNITIVPYGKANETQVGNLWQFTCQHGPNECWGNLLQTCANHMYPFIKYFPFAACIMIEPGPIQNSSVKCAQRIDMNYLTLQTCMNSSAANDWEHQYGLQTGALSPTLNYVPWVTISGMHTDDMQQKAESDLLDLICSYYTGQKPPACGKMGL